MSKLTQSDLLLFEKLQQDLKKIKTKELEVRKKIINHFRYNKVEGVQHKSIGDSDIDIAITLKLTRTLDEDALDALWSELSRDQRACITYVPRLNLKMYKDLLKNGEQGELMNIITEKPALASVELKYDE